MTNNNQTFEITVTPEEKAIIDGLSRKCHMTSNQLLRTILFGSGILVSSESQAGNK